MKDAIHTGFHTIQKNAHSLILRLKQAENKIFISFLSSFIFVLIITLSVYFFNTQGTSYTWDGGGGDNNFSTCANWSSDTCPTSTDDIVFNGTSTKDATIDASFQGTAANISINSGYTGTITQSRSFTVSSTFTQAAGSYTATNQTLSVNIFTLSSGSFTASSGTINITFNLTISGGTFIHNSGTVAFLNANHTISCNNATFNLVTLGVDNGGTTTINSSCSLPLGNNPTITSGGCCGGSLVIKGSLTGTGSLDVYSYISGVVIDGTD